MNYNVPVREDYIKPAPEAFSALVESVPYAWPSGHHTLWWIFDFASAGGKQMEKKPAALSNTPASSPDCSSICPRHNNYVARFSFRRLKIPADENLKFIERLHRAYIVREPKPVSGTDTTAETDMKPAAQPLGRIDI